MISISVVIPCYNASKTIERCVESVIKQTYKVDEIVLIDDCSTDETWTILENIEVKHKNTFFIQLISTGKNSGPSVARNMGIEASKSNWIAFLDADDYWDVSKIEKQVSIYKQNNDVKLISCAYKKKKLPEVVSSKEISFRRACFKNYFETPTVLAE